MKKNKMMRIASILMVVTLLSTCAISGTFAKYVTKVSGEDQARVAKWGILLELTAGDVFDKTYPAHDEDTDLELTVEADEKVVAPGTSSKDVDGSIKGKATGKPEVATRYALSVAEFEDIILPAGTYTDYTEAVKGADGKYAYTKTFTLEKDYTPVKWDLLINGKSLAKYIVENSGQAEALARYGLTEAGVSLTDAKAIAAKVADLGVESVVAEMIAQKIPGATNFMIDMENLSISIDVPANTEVTYEFELVWNWAFVNGAEISTGIYEFDAADTYLGNVIAGAVTDANAKTTIKANVTASATQID